jgi:hypothetical protein
MLVKKVHIVVPLPMSPYASKFGVSAAAPPVLADKIAADVASTAAAAAILLMIFLCIPVNLPVSLCFVAITRYSAALDIDWTTTGLRGSADCDHLGRATQWEPQPVAGGFMNMRRIATILAGFLSFVAVTSETTGTASAEPDLPPCQTTPWRSEVVHQFSTGKWGYLYRLVWCVEQTKIKWAVPDVVPVLPDASDCTWKSPLANSLERVPDSDNWLGFNMGWFSCPVDGGTDGDYPWGIIIIRPDGTSAIQDQRTG